MKKIILSLILFHVLANNTFSQNVISQPLQEADKSNIAQQTVAIVTEKKEILKSTGTTDITPVNHWSIGIKGGINYFRLAAATINRTDQFHFMVGGTLEYTINPLIGLGLEYNYNPFGCRTSNLVITGSTNDAILYGSVNLSNLLIPNRAGNSKLNVYADGGVGFAFYNFSFNHVGVQTDQSAMAKLGLNVEYTISKSLSLGLEGQYRYYNWKLEQVNTIYNTEAITTTIGLRYKFNATGKKQHVRNMAMSDYNTKPAPVIIEKVVKDNTIETLNRLKAIEDENAALKDNIRKLSEDILALSSLAQPELNTSFQNIEFEFGSDKLDISSYRTLDQIADILIHNSALVKLSVAGFTDYIGSGEYNKILSVKRANAVKDYLLVKNVSLSRISIAGYGKENPLAPNVSVVGRQKNRRVELQIMK